MARTVVVVALAVAALAACAPQFDGGAYRCGPERLCPPDLECDEPSLTCESPVLAQPFACPEGSEAREPDDAADQAHAAGEVRCSMTLVEGMLGCIEGDDVDQLAFTYGDDCSGDPRLYARLRFPLSLAPLALVLVDEAGAEIAVAEPCDLPGERDVDAAVCLEVRPPPGAYRLRIELAGDRDCDGDCRYNSYQLDIAQPLS